MSCQGILFLNQYLNINYLDDYTYMLPIDVHIISCSFFWCEQPYLDPGLCEPSVSCSIVWTQNSNSVLVKTCILLEDNLLTPLVSQVQNNSSISDLRFTVNVSNSHLECVYCD